MKHSFFKRAVTLAITAAMLAGNVVTAFAQEIPKSTETSSFVVAEGSTEESNNEVDSTGEIGTGEIGIGEISTEDISTGEISSEEISTEEDTTHEQTGIEKWVAWTDWNNESFKEFLYETYFWNDEEIAAYKELVAEESREGLETYAAGLKLEEWEEILHAELDSEVPWGSYERILSILPEINLGTGSWQTDERGLYYVKEDGTKAIGWYEMVEDIWYYFDDNGYRKTGWHKEDGRWYYLNKVGIMLRDSRSYIDDYVYYFSKSGAMQTGWHKIEKYWYYFEPDGAMSIGWEKVGATWYYLNYDGSMATGWIKVKGTWYYLGDNGAMKTGWQKIDGAWYYLGGSGAMKTGWMNDGVSWYYLSSSGAMQTGWVEIGTNWFYFYSNGVMAANTFIGEWYVDENGYYVSTYMTDAQILGKLEYLKTKYPNGKYWNHVGISTSGDTSEIVTNNPCIHSGNSYEYCNRYDIFNADIQGYSWIQGYQCAGFAFKLSDEIFGTDADRIYYDYDFDSIRIGDTIRVGEYFGNYGHSFVVIGKSENYITIAECNAGNTCKITWGRTISRSELNSEYKVMCETRRP